MKKAFSLIAGISMLAMTFIGCGNGAGGGDDNGGKSGPGVPSKVTKDFTQPDQEDLSTTQWAYITYDLSEFAGKEVTIDFSCEMKVTGSAQDNDLQWQVNTDDYPVVTHRVFKADENDWIKVEGSNESPIAISAGKCLYLSSYQCDTANLKISLRNIKYTVSYGSNGDKPADPAEPPVEYPTDIFKIGEAGTCGIKIGDKDLIPFNKALQFDAVVQDVVYNADGSVTWTAKAAGGAGGGVAFYFDEAKSILNSGNYDSVDIELTYSPVTGAWSKSTQVPGFCLRLLTFDSTGVFGGAVDAEYFDAPEMFGDLKKNVDFNTLGIKAKVEDAADFDGLKAFVIKFNDYQRNSDGDLLKVQLKKITFNRKDGAPADAPYDDGLTDAQRGKVYSVEYPTKDYAEIASKNSAISAAKEALAKAEKIEDADKKAAAIAKANEDLAKAEAIVLSDAAIKGYNKHAWVYTPAGYNPEDKDTKYPVMVLLHGFGQNENTWGLSDKGDGGKIKGYMDRGIADKSVEPFILICVTGVASKNWGPNGNGQDFNGFNAFSPELRDDILPYMYANYNCIEDRDHTALAGLSMGGGQTFNNGLKDNLDKISYFGAFSAAVFTDAATYKADVEEKWAENPELKVHYLYMICGDADTTVYGTYPDFVKAFNAEAWPTRIEKFSETTIPGGTHDFPVWFKGFKEFITYIFQ